MRKSFDQGSIVDLIKNRSQHIWKVGKHGVSWNWRAETMLEGRVLTLAQK